MGMLHKTKITTGVYWVEIPQAGLSILCGCPADSVKHLRKMGFIATIERRGVTCETGPNAILLSDVLMQNGMFTNLAEFPVLQMLYRQGLILPNHPNNTGQKPLLIGTEDQVKAQMEYVYRGNYGLVSLEEIMQAGVPRAQAEEMMRLKLKFAFGQIRPTHELLEARYATEKPVELRNGAFIQRRGFNLYEFRYGNESLTVDLNLRPDESYESPYQLGFHQLKREFFAVIHSGEGDGWDMHRPCMGSILMFQGKIYLIDAGPNIHQSLVALGIDTSEIQGLFHTHAHDDHFAGLPSLMRADHRIQYYATPIVRASVAKKLGALMSMDEHKFEQYFDIHDLKMDVWNDIQGLQVKPLFSPHPVETNLFVFRAFGHKQYKTYAHFADIATLGVLERMIHPDSKVPGLSREFYEKIKADYLTPVCIKKLDVGGELIHGRAEDFAEDASGKIILSHTSNKLSNSQKEIGSEAPFGMVDLLIPSEQDYLRQHALSYLREYFPTVPFYELQALLNSRIISLNAGGIILKNGQHSEYVYLILTGSVEFFNSQRGGTAHMLSTGSIIGDLAVLKDLPAQKTYRAVSYVQALQIPGELYRLFVEGNHLYADIDRTRKHRQFLRNHALFRDSVSYPVLNQLAQQMTLKTYPADVELPTSAETGLYIFLRGEAQMFAEGTILERMEEGSFCGEDVMLFGYPGYFNVQTLQPTQVYYIPQNLLLQIPIVHWKLLETFAKRMKGLVAYFLSD